MKISLRLSCLSSILLAVSLSSCASVKGGANAIVEGTGNAAKSVASVFGSGAKENTPTEVKTHSENRYTSEELLVSDVTGAAPKKAQAEEEKNRFKIYPFKRMTPEEKSMRAAQRKERKLEKAWGQIVDRSEMRLVGDDRVRIDVESPFIMDVEEMEYLLLARAAGEAARAGYDRFAIVYIEYSGGRGLSNFLLPEMKMTSSDWVGSYEALISERESQRLMGKYKKIGYKQLDAVVLFISGEDKRRRDSFPASELYVNMLNERLYGGKYPYK